MILPELRPSILQALTDFWLSSVPLVDCGELEMGYGSLVLVGLRIGIAILAYYARRHIKNVQRYGAKHLMQR